MALRRQLPTPWAGRAGHPLSPGQGPLPGLLQAGRGVRSVPAWPWTQACVCVSSRCWWSKWRRPSSRVGWGWAHGSTGPLQACRSRAGRRAGRGAAGQRVVGRATARAASGAGTPEHLRTEAGMSPCVLGQVVTASEALAAQRAGKSLLTGVRPMMAGQLVGACKLLLTAWPVAGKGAFTWRGAGERRTGGGQTTHFKRVKNADRNPNPHPCPISPGHPTGTQSRDTGQVGVQGVGDRERWEKNFPSPPPLPAHPPTGHPRPHQRPRYALPGAAAACTGCGTRVPGVGSVGSPRHQWPAAWAGRRREAGPPGRGGPPGGDFLHRPLPPSMLRLPHPVPTPSVLPNPCGGGGPCSRGGCGILPQV